MDSNLIVIINVIFLVVVFLLKCLHDYYEKKHILHPKIDAIQNVLDQITNNNIIPISMM